MTAMERRPGFRRPGRPSKRDTGRPAGKPGRPPARSDRQVPLSTIVECMGLSVEDARELYARLTDRQRQVADLMAQGLTNREIADELGISPKTLDIHRSDTFQKLEARTHAAVAAIVFLVALADAAEGRA